MPVKPCCYARPRPSLSCHKQYSTNKTGTSAMMIITKPGRNTTEGDSNIRYHPLILIVVMTTDHTSNQFYNMSSLHIIIMDTNNFIFNGFPFALSALMLNLFGIIIITASSMGGHDGNRKIKTSSVDSKQQIFCFTKNFLPGPL